MSFPVSSSGLLKAGRPSRMPTRENSAPTSAWSCRHCPQDCAPAALATLWTMPSPPGQGFAVRVALLLVQSFCAAVSRLNLSSSVHARRIHQSQTIPSHGRDPFTRQQGHRVETGIHICARPESPAGDVINHFRASQTLFSAVQRLALFVDGCFWHGCPKHGRQPGTNTAYWAQKLSRNKARDRSVSRTLRQAGWMVIRLWEHHLSAPVAVAAKISRALAKKRCSHFPAGCIMNHLTK